MKIKLFKKKNKKGIKEDSLQLKKIELENLLEQYKLENASNKDKIDLMVRIKQINTLLDKLNLQKKRGK